MAGILSVIPFVNFVNCCFCAWLLVGGAVAAKMLINRAPRPVRSGEGAQVGAVAGLIAAHRARPPGHLVTMLGFRTDDPHSCGILELDDRGSVVAFHEKVSDPPGNLANGAVYVFEPEIIDAIAGVGRPVVDLSTEIIPPLVGRILCVETDGYHRDIGTPQSLSQARAEFAGRVRQPAVVSDGCR